MQRGKEKPKNVECPIDRQASSSPGATPSVATEMPGKPDLAHEVFGEPDAPAVVLIPGLGSQMIEWDARFCAELAAQGLQVIRIDNRDAGLSRRHHECGVPDVREMLTMSMLGVSVTAPYTLRDMAADVVDLLDFLGIDKAHVVGMSMGGAIAQEFAIHWPQRTLTLTSIMSNAGDPGFPPPSPIVMSILMDPLPKECDAYCIDYAKRWRRLRGASLPVDEEEDLRRARLAYERGVSRAGVVRQLAALIASPSRMQALAGLRVPALIIHGEDDPLVHADSARAMAKAIPHAELLIIKGMGHALPVLNWSVLISAIVRHAASYRKKASC